MKKAPTKIVVKKAAPKKKATFAASPYKEQIEQVRKLKKVGQSVPLPAGCSDLEVASNRLRAALYRYGIMASAPAGLRYSIKKSETMGVGALKVILVPR